MTPKLTAGAARFAAGAAMLLIAGLGYASLRQGLADFYVQSARQEVDQWVVQKRLVRSADWTRVIGYLEQGLEFAPRNAWGLEELGMMHFNRAQTATDSVVAVAAARAAHVNLRRALVERPSSPFIWVSLARARLALGSIDAELFDALRHAGELGPWEPEAQLGGALAGLAAWPKAGAAERAMILAVVARAATTSPDKMLEIAKQFNRVELLCDKNLEKPNSAALAACMTPDQKASRGKKS